MANGISPSQESKLRPAVTSMGCRLNIAEGEAITELASAAGLHDAVVINSCAVTNEAVRQTRQAIRRTRRAEPTAKIIVTGCAAQIDADQFAAMPEVDAVLGNDEKLKPESWNEIADIETSTDTRVRVNDIMSVRQTVGHLIDGYGEKTRGFLQVQNGCNHRCTFCIIPYGRGNARSAKIDEVCEQAQRLVDNGHKELVVTGVDITSWGEDLDGQPPLGALINSILTQTKGLFRLRLSSIDGAEIDPTLAALISDNQIIAPHIHLSVQSGDDMILKRMKRRHTREGIITLCDRLKAARPEIAFGADIIAGFPTETDEMFENSLRLIEEAHLTHLHVFPFSPREGTPAARMPQVNGNLIKERAAALRAAGAEAFKSFLDTQVGRTLDGVCESGNSVRLGNYAVVKITEPVVRGDIVRVKVEGRDGQLLTGSIG
ncbi:MAG: tRNA (N(6)-L-threonylcarbamoyladenosine(37)-C(2))-methylthiotransferase MtaB [Pseudomonadota bacterium]